MSEVDINQYEVDVTQLNFKLRDKLNRYLELLIEKGGSDLHIKSGGLVRGRFNGEIMPMSREILSREDGITLAKELLKTSFRELVINRSVDFTHKLNDDYRFRANMFFQMEGVSAVFRAIPTKIPTFEEVNLPPVLEKICNNSHRGIILVTGPTGSGKTTTLAAMINQINKTKKRHIITIEDPIEFVYSDEKSIINQRAIGQDALNFADALRASLREDPDVILIGEMRDLETIEAAIHAAETGHLVLSTLHTIDAKETINRIVSMFQKEDQHRIKLIFASVLTAIVSQRLVKTVDNKRRAAVEILIKNLRIKDIMLGDNNDDIYTAISESKNTYGMQTFDQHLLELYEQGIITIDEALEKSSKPNDLEIKIKNVNLAREKALLKRQNQLMATKNGEEAHEDEEVSHTHDIIALKKLD